MTQDSQLRNVLKARARLGEGPVWDSEQQLLYWVDIYNHCIHQFNPATNHDRTFEVSDTVGAIAVTSQERLIMALRHQLAFLDLKTGEVETILPIEADQPQNRFNDGKCDVRGRFWFGSMCTVGPKAKLYCLDTDRSLRIMETGLTISNGLGWSPDSRTFYLADSPLKTIFAYDFDLESGSIEHRRVFVDLTAEAAYPDGLTVDQDGCVWSAMWDGWCIIRFDPQGHELERLSMPVQRPTSCAFGGPGLKNLYITSASVGLSEAEIQDSFFSGDLFCFESSVKGQPMYRYEEQA